MKYQILHGDNRATLKTLPDNSIDAIVTDPPYGIDFLGKDWDVNTGAVETYQECLRVLKPGGHILAFSAARTYHHLAITLEQAGFEIRDQIMWIYSSGFPKSQDVGKSIDRQSGKASHKAELAEVKAILKQLYEESGKSTAEISRECGFNAGGYLKTDFKDKGWANNLPKDDKWLTLKSVLGCGDEYDDYFITTPQVKVGEKETGCFGPGSDYTIGGRGHTVDVTASQTDAGKAWSGWGTALKPAHEPIALARKPIKLSIARNCQTHGVGALNIDACRIQVEGADTRSGGSNGVSRLTFGEGITTNEDSHIGYEVNDLGRFPSNVIGDIPDYQKYFYCPKVSRAERHIGHETPPPMFGDMKGAYDNNGERYAVGLDARSGPVGNNHPTVKPIELMKYLIRLITPPGGTVLDPFSGSGSTGCAAVELGMEYIGCELDERYVEIADKRIRAWYEHCNPTMYNQLFEQAA
jgi:DNA modification methylase